MDFADPAQWRVFLDVHTGLPREGPGNRASTARALALMGPLPPAPLIVDVACGPGAQTLDLAELVPDARFVAVDANPPYVEELRRRAHEAGLGHRIDACVGDMRALPFAPGSVDAIWCEGAAYIVGVAAALAAWAPLLEPGGCIALTEAVWLKPDPPERVRANWLEYPAMTDVAACRAIIACAGLKLLGDFVLPESAWLDDYYGPLEARARQLVDKYRGDAVAQSVVAQSIEEVAVYREFSAFYGYQFFVMST
jgi:SAM-dependent methyltransferase